MKYIILLCSLFLIVSCQNNQTEEEELQQIPGEKTISEESKQFNKKYEKVKNEEKRKKEKQNVIEVKVEAEAEIEIEVSTEEHHCPHNPLLQQRRKCLNEIGTKRLIYLAIGGRIGKCRIALGNRGNACGMYMKVYNNPRVITWEQNGWPQSYGSRYSTGCIPFSKNIESGSSYGCGTKKGYGEAWERMGGPSNFCSHSPHHNAAVYIRDAINHHEDPCDLESMLEEDPNYLSDICEES